jgi:rhamnose utilization protein RhaD (predicted bifunctional aldolase and dehydrogenase)
MTNGYSILYNKDYSHHVKQLDITFDKKDNEQVVNEITKTNVLIKTTKTSIETPMHSFLQKWVVHLHPIQVNILLNKAPEMIKKLFPDALLIDYYTPGIELSLNILHKYNGEHVIFLINHGIIITHDSVDEIYHLLDMVIEITEKYLNLQREYAKYHNVNTLSSLFNGEDNSVNHVSYLCDHIDVTIEDDTRIVEIVPLTPDIFIYCGYGILHIGDDACEWENSIRTYKEKYNDIPKIVTYNNALYIVSVSLKKCMEIEQVFKSYLILNNDGGGGGGKCLTKEELLYLNNWEAEKYRKNI